MKGIGFFLCPWLRHTVRRLLMPDDLGLASSFDSSTRDACATNSSGLQGTSSSTSVWRRLDCDNTRDLKAKNRFRRHPFRIHKEASDFGCHSPLHAPLELRNDLTGGCPPGLGLSSEHSGSWSSQRVLHRVTLLMGAWLYVACMMRLEWREDLADGTQDVACRYWRLKLRLVK